MRTIRIGSRQVGPGTPCFIVAEIGINHNGDLDLAKKMIEAAARAGADAVKFQSYRTEDFVSDRSVSYQYVFQGRSVSLSQYELFKRCELSRESLLELNVHSARQGVLFHSTPTSDAGIRDLVEMGVPVLKNGSDYLTHLALIRAMGQTGLPTVLSTGMATLAEVDEAVRTFRETGNDQLVLLHCTSTYPTPPEDVHLRRIPALATVFGCPVGLSDHTSGIATAIAAAALGACWIEKHFTLSKELPGPDHHFSADPPEFLALVEAVRTVEKCLGDSRVGPTPSEISGRRQFRLSCVAARSLSSGHILAEQDLAFHRPGTGLSPTHSHVLVGRTLTCAIEAGKPIHHTDVS